MITCNCVSNTVLKASVYLSDDKFWCVDFFKQSREVFKNILDLRLKTKEKKIKYDCELLVPYSCFIM